MTKIKAIQALREIIRSRSPSESSLSSDATAALPPFIYQYRRLSLDSSRGVRQEASLLMGELIVASGRSSAPHLKSLMGPWYQAQFDLHPDVASSARNSFEASFSSSKKRLDALLFCKTELLDHLTFMSVATKEVGDPKRDSPEELEDRHERAVSSSLLALAALLDLLTSAQSSPDFKSSLPAIDATLIEMERFVMDHALGHILKTLIKSKSRLIRSSAYSFLGALAAKRPSVFDLSLDDASLSILGSFQESDPLNHGAMWNMILSFANTFPDCWTRCNFKKAVLPRLKALIRHNFHGSSSTSFPALLPLFSLMSKCSGLMGPSIELSLALLDSSWEGAMLESTQVAHPPAALAYQECLSWLLIHSHQLSQPADDQLHSDEFESDFCRQLVSSTLTRTIAPLALMLESDGDAAKVIRKAMIAANVLSTCICKVLTSKASMPASAAIEIALENALSSAAEVIGGLKPCNSNRQAISDRVVHLLDLLCLGMKEDRPQGVSGPSFTSKLASLTARKLSATSQGPHASPTSFQLMAHLVRVHGASISDSDASISQLGETSSTSSLDSILESFCSTSCTRASADSLADLTASLLFQSSDNESWSVTLDRLSMIADPEARSSRIRMVLERTCMLISHASSVDKRTAIRSWISFDLSNQLGTKLMGDLNSQGSEARALLLFLCGANTPRVCFLNNTDLVQIMTILYSAIMSNDTNLSAFEILDALLSNGPHDVLQNLAQASASSLASIVSRIADLSCNNFLLPSERLEVNSRMDMLGVISFHQEEEDMAPSSELLATQLWNSGNLLARSLKAFEASGISSAQDLLSSLTKSLVRLMSQTSIIPVVVAWKVASVHKALESSDGQDDLLDVTLNAAKNTDGDWACDLAVNLFVFIGSAVFRHGRSWLLSMVLRRQEGNDDLEASDLTETVLVSFVSSCLDGQGGAEERESLLQAMDELTHTSLTEAVIYSLRIITLDEGPRVLNLITDYMTRSILPSFQLSLAADDLHSLARVHSRVLGSIAPNLRSQPLSYLTGISSASTYWMTVSKKLPCVSFEPSLLSINVLRAALSCFPLPPPSSSLGHTITVTDDEALALRSLVKHQARAVRQAALAASRRLQQEIRPESTLVQQAQSLVLDLEATACYLRLDNGDGSMVDQQFVRDAQEALSEALSHVESQASKLSTAIRIAASSLLSPTPSPAANAYENLPSGTMSVQLLSRLKDKGLLRDHALLPQLTSAFREVLRPNEGHEEICVSAARLSRMILIASDCNDSRFDEIQELLLRLVLALGTNFLLSNLAQSVTEEQTPAAHLFHSELSSALDGGMRGGSKASVNSTRGSWVARACRSHEEFSKAKDLGVDSLDSLLSLALASHPLSNTAFMCLLDPNSSLLPRICSPPLDFISEDSSTYPEFDAQEGDEKAFLTSKCGIRSPIASSLVEFHSLDDVVDEIEDAREDQGGGGDDSPLTNYLTAWSLVLSQLSSCHAADPVTMMLSHALREVTELPSSLFNALAPLLPLNRFHPNGSSSSYILQPSASQVVDVAANPLEPVNVNACLELSRIGRPVIGSGRDEQVAVVLYSSALQTLPAGARSWYADLRDKNLASAVDGYTSARVSPSLIAYELQLVQERYGTLPSSVGGGEGNFSVRAAAGGREVVVTLEVEDGAKLELAVTLPSCSPLKPAECEARKKVGVSEAKLRKWILSISVFMRSQNRSVADAIDVWRSNVNKEFEGVESCLICYSVVSAHNGQLPKLQCKTCNVRFHPGCLLKWFKSSGKSVCVHCQAPW